MRDPITVISSMALKAVLSDLAQSYELRAGRRVSVESVGGVDVRKRVQAGETRDVVALASDAIDELIACGHLLEGSKVDVVCSDVAVAVRAGASRPAIGSEEELERAVLAAGTIGCSTGPSGAGLQALFERWGIAEQMRERIVISPPGVPVGGLVARGDVALGFQQLSELMQAEGVDVLGLMPEGTRIVTTFSAGVGAASLQPEAAQVLIAFLASPVTAFAKRRQGMYPAEYQLIPVEPSIR
jgi:molybdate transport system substrate-binding protein